MNEKYLSLIKNASFYRNYFPIHPVLHSVLNSALFYCHTVTFMLLCYQKRYCYYYKIGRSYTMAIGERIKRIRNFRKLTQAQLGESD